MSTTFQDLLYQAESEYLVQKNVEILKFKLEEIPGKLRVYKGLRDREAEIFQSVADEIELTVSDEEIEIVKLEIKNWIYILRGCSMGMLLDNLNFVKQRLLDWISDREIANSRTEIRHLSGQVLIKTLQDKFSSEEVELIEPYLSQALIQISSQLLI